MNAGNSDLSPTRVVIPGSVAGRPCKVVIGDGSVFVELDGTTHGPRPIRGALASSEKGRVWTVGLGTIRVTFVPDDVHSMTRAVADALVGDEADIVDLIQTLPELAATFDEGMASMQRGLDNLSVISRFFGGEEFDTAELQRLIETRRTQHRDFLRVLAPRGWAQGPSFEGDLPDLPFLSSHVIAVKMIERGDTPESVDAWLADLVLEQRRTTTIVQNMADTQLRAVWQWAPLAGEAAAAMRKQLWGPAAAAWMIVAEGMWRSSVINSGAPQAIFFSKGRSHTQAITEIMTASRDSFIVAHDAMSQPSTKTYLEPIEISPTSRHGLVHGRIAGFVSKVHAAKAFTLVDALLEQANQLTAVLPSDALESPPWSA